MKFKTISLACFAIFALCTASKSSANQIASKNNNSSDMQSNTEEKFAEMFVSNVEVGCLSSVSNEIKKPKIYCSCYAKSFLNRYSKEDLLIISNAAGSTKNGGAIVAVMMRPEMRQCALK